MATIATFKPDEYLHTFTHDLYLYETDLTYMESARFDLFKKLDLFDPHNILSLRLILVWVECDYIEISRYNDTLTIRSRISEIGLSRFVIEHVFVRESDNAIVAEGKVVIVYFNHEKNSSMPIPNEMRYKLQRYQTENKE